MFILPNLSVVVKYLKYSDSLGSFELNLEILSLAISSRDVSRIVSRNSPSPLRSTFLLTLLSTYFRTASLTFSGNSLAGYRFPYSAIAVISFSSNSFLFLILSKTFW